MSSIQANPDQGMTLVDFLCQDTHDFSDVIDFKATKDSSPESQSLLEAPAHQHRPGGKTSKWFDMTFRGAKLQDEAVKLRARVEEFEHDTKDYPRIRKSQEGKVGGQDVTLEYPRNESDVVQVCADQYKNRIHSVATAKQAKNPAVHQWFPLLSSIFMAKHTELSLLELKLETLSEHGIPSPDSSTVMGDTGSSSVRVDMNWVLSARKANRRDTRKNLEAAAASASIVPDDYEPPKKQYLPRGVFWTLKDVEALATGGKDRKEYFKSQLPVEYKRLGSLRRALFEVLAHGNGIPLSDKVDDRTLERQIAAFEVACYPLKEFSDNRRKVRALRGTISMIQQVVRYAHDYHVDTIVICDYVSCVVITMPPRLKSTKPDDPPKYKDNSTFEWYFASRTQTGDAKQDVKSLHKYDTGTALLALGMELWRALQRFRRELEEYVGDDELEKKLKNIKL